MLFGDKDHPFYKPLWRRLLIIAVAAAWAGFELIFARDGFWVIVSVAMLGYAVVVFLLQYQTKPPQD